MFFNKIKYLTGTFLILLFCTQLTAKPIQVLGVTQDFASIAKSIGGNLVSVDSLVKGSRNLHNINPRPSMVLKLRKSDLLVRIGMEQDTWVDGLIQVARKPALFPGNKGYLDCSQEVEKLEVPTGKIDGRLGDVHKMGNPHYWLSPENGLLIGKQIRDALIKIDPINKTSYENNYYSFSKELKEKTIIWKESIKGNQSTLFITYHKVWPYFFHSFGLESIGELEPLPGIPPTTKHLSNLKNRALKSNYKKIVLTANFYPSSAGNSFAKSIDAKHVVVATNVGENGINSYFALFDYLIKEITR